MPERTTAEWLQILKVAQIPAIQINEIDDVISDPHLQATGLFREREHPTEGAYVEVRPPVRFSGFDYPDLRHAPAKGQHTDELNDELGLGRGS
jgi:crotonobetainyl-CoA:carnitine CoA-transferase CaiB-like acyl-CoA transferase